MFSHTQRKKAKKKQVIASSKKTGDAQPFSREENPEFVRSFVSSPGSRDKRLDRTSCSDALVAHNAALSALSALVPDAQFAGRLRPQSVNGMTPASVSSRNHSCHHALSLDSNVVRSVSSSSVSASLATASLSVGSSAAAVAAAVGSSPRGGLGRCTGGGAGVAREDRCMRGLGGVEGGLSRSRFSLIK